MCFSSWWFRFDGILVRHFNCFNVDHLSTLVQVPSPPTLVQVQINMESNFIFAKFLIAIAEHIRKRPKTVGHLSAINTETMYWLLNCAKFNLIRISAIRLNHNISYMNEERTDRSVKYVEFRYSVLSKLNNITLNKITVRNSFALSVYLAYICRYIQVPIPITTSICAMS